eukprot:1160114-Pelagomonas_calceolata.AAC.21
MGHAIPADPSDLAAAWIIGTTKPYMEKLQGPVNHAAHAVQAFPIAQRVSSWARMHAVMQGT